jgi:hypothetical protein
VGFFCIDDFHIFGTFCIRSLSLVSVVYLVFGVSDPEAVNNSKLTFI